MRELDSIPDTDSYIGIFANKKEKLLTGIFDPDVYSDYEVSAEAIVGNHVWTLWWD